MKNIAKLVIRHSLPACLLVAVGLVAVSAGSYPVWAQDDGPRSAAPDTMPLPELNVAGIIKAFGLIETKQPAREFIKGWRKPKKTTAGRAGQQRPPPRLDEGSGACRC